MTKRSDDEDAVTEERVADALTKLGADKNPPPGWEEAVRVASGPEMSADYRARVRRLLDHRLNRLYRLFALEAPDALIAQEVALIGSTATMIDPHGIARREAEASERKARTLIGLCARAGCEHEPAEGMLEYDSEYCGAHAAQLRADTAYEDGGTYDQGAPKVTS